MDARACIFSPENIYIRPHGLRRRRVSDVGGYIVVVPWPICAILTTPREPPHGNYDSTGCLITRFGKYRIRGGTCVHNAHPHSGRRAACVSRVRRDHGNNGHRHLPKTLRTNATCVVIRFSACFELGNNIRTVQIISFIISRDRFIAALIKKSLQ